MDVSLPRSVSEEEIAVAAARIHAVIAPLSRALRRGVPEGFTATQLSVLGSIRRHGPVSLGELADRERLSPPTISKVVAALDESGVICRIDDPKDRRVCLVEISPSGRRWAEGEANRRNAWLARRLEMLPDDRLRSVLDALAAFEQLAYDD